MTFSYNCTTEALSITSSNIQLFIDNPGTYTIDILIDDTSESTAPATNPVVIASVDKDAMLDVKIKLTTVATESITIEQGCLFTDCETLCNVVELANTDQSYKILLDYYLLTQANNCPCECTKLKEIATELLLKVNDCQC